MIIHINLTEEHLKLISAFNAQLDGDTIIYYDSKWLYGGTHIMEDLALILGYQDKAVKGTENDAEGRAYDEETEKHMKELHQYIVDNFFYIENLIHYYSTRGGLKVGEYTCKDNELIWEYKG